MTPHEFIKKWHNSPIKERAAAQAHFLDLCRLLGEPEPADVDPTGQDYGFEVGATKTTGGNGFADVFKRGHFAWEYKGTLADLDAAFAQLQRYAVALDNPPLLIVSDIGTTIRIHTNWTNSVSKRYDVGISELEDPEKRRWLKSAFSEPEALKPAKTRQELTEEVAGDFATVARLLRERGHPPEPVAHFINRLVFCMFAEDVKLLPDGLFTKMLERSLVEPREFETFARQLFAAMRTRNGGHVGFDRVKWFNGGLFDDDLAYSLTRVELELVHSAAKAYWGDIDPSILGALFERGLDPDKRSQLGAHYTDRDKIMMIVEPVIIEPLSAEWEGVKQELSRHYDTAAAAQSILPAVQREARKTYAAARRREETALRAASAAFERYMQRLRDFRVLDPACGSGNFLYMALTALKDLEHKVALEMEAIAGSRGFLYPVPPPSIGPENVLGIEINSYAAELARVSVWIGEIQWMLRHGYAAAENPILKPLDMIQCRNALAARASGKDGSNGCWVEASWPEADAIIGNPPFIAARDLENEIGSAEVTVVRQLYGDRLAAETDYVGYWFLKSLEVLDEDDRVRVGLVCTSSLPRGRSRPVLDAIAARATIFQARSDEPWTISQKTHRADKASVRVSVVCFAKHQADAILDGAQVTGITADLRPASHGFQIERVARLESNIGWANQGVIPRSEVNAKEKRKLALPDASFLVDAEEGLRLLSLPLNPNGRPNSDVVRPYLVGEDIIDRPRYRFIIDFTGLTEMDAALFQEPFRLLERVRQHRARMKQPEALRRWWLPWNNRDRMRRQLRGLAQYVATPRNSKHRVFVMVPASYIPDCEVVVFPKDDYTHLGILQSRFHEHWTLRNCSFYGVANTPRYSHRATFETFSFPAGLGPNVPAADYATDPRAIAIADAAKRLSELRESWLNPSDLVRREPEVVAGFPDRILPVDDNAAEPLKGRTLTKLYNERPAWLDHAHRSLDAAVAAAYGWPADLSVDEVLARLFALNQVRAGSGQGTAMASAVDEDAGEEIAAGQ